MVGFTSVSNILTSALEVESGLALTLSSCRLMTVRKVLRYPGTKHRGTASAECAAAVSFSLHSDMLLYLHTGTTEEL